MSNTPSPWGNYQFGPSQQSSGSGYKLPPPDQRYDPGEDAANKALWMGIASLVLCWCVPGTVMGILAIMQGWNAMQSDNPSTKTKGMIGMICGIVCVVIGIIMTILFVVLAVAGELMDQGM